MFKIDKEQEAAVTEWRVNCLLIRGKLLCGY